VENGGDRRSKGEKIKKMRKEDKGKRG